METTTKEKIPSAKQIPLLNEAYQIHQDLLKTIQIMDEKIDQVIKQHEAQFLLAYRNHIKTMKEQLTSIKQKADEQEKKMLSNDRAVFLEKQLILFREEALKLYDKLEEKTQECEHNKSQVRQFQKAKSIVQKQNKELLRENKNLQALLGLQQSKIKELEQQVFNAKNELQTCKASLKNISKGHTLQTNFQFTDNMQQPFTPKPKDSFNFSAQSKKYSKNPSFKSQHDTIQKKLSHFKNSRRTSQEWMDHQLKNWFMQCIETIRKEVAQRKVYGYKSQDMNGIPNWQQFRMIDKLRLLQMFMQNQKLLVWMYQKIFPSRVSEIEMYLSNKKPSSFDNREKSKSMHISMDQIEPPNNERESNSLLDDLGNDHILPKVIPFTGKKTGKKLYDVRQRIDMRNGKLNLSSIPSDI